ncbi:MAG: beta-ketoacyl-ACP synthase III [Pseudomonadota bacterium]
MATIRAVPLGVGHYLPEKIVTNADFEKSIETSDEWIRARTGIAQRHFAKDGEFTSDLAINAAKDALADAGIEASEIDSIVLATSTPDQTFPSTATKVQAALGTSGFAFDIQAVCAGFIFALANANAQILAGQAKRVLVIGAETFSRILDFNDRTTCVLFGDGAGALILEAQEGNGDLSDRGILTSDLYSDGRYNDILYVDGGVSSTQSTGYLKMQGQEVFKHAVTKLSASGKEAMSKLKLTGEDISWVIPHQANIRIIKKVAEKLGLSMDKIVVTVEHHGNTSAASIPLAMSEANKKGQLKQGDLILSEAIGGGLAWGSVIFRW